MTMIQLYVLDVPEFQPVIEEAQRSADAYRRIGFYYEFRSEGPLVLDRHRAQSRKAVWFSSIGALRGGAIEQFDVDAIRIEPLQDSVPSAAEKIELAAH